MSIIACTECGKLYDNSKGGIMIPVCYECQKKPPKPDAFIKHKGLLISNPANSQCK